MSKPIPFVCNANSYGSIDYGKPLIFGDKDYRTSTGLYHKYIPQPFREEHFADNVRFGAQTRLKNPYLDKSFWMTTNREAYTKKYMKPMPLETAKTSSHCMDVHYVTTIKEKFYKNPPKPAKLPISEYNNKYVQREQLPFIYSPPLTNECKLQSNGSDEQPRTILEAGGVYKLLDPYLSTTRLVHFPFTPEMIKFGSADTVPTFYKSLKEPYTGPVPKEPVNDCTVFKNPIRSRIIPEKLCPVPHIGTSSEYSSKYKGPTLHPTYDLILMDREAVEYHESIPEPNKIQTQCAPGMYCTEKCHYGSDWAPDRIIDPKGRFQKKIKVHEIPCYSQVVG